MSSKVVMVVEDDVDIRRQVVDALELEGYLVFEAENGREALDVLQELDEHEYPCCIILDLMMPFMDGRMFMEEIQRHHKETLGQIPIVVATAKGSRINPHSLPLETDRISKPFELDQLYEVVERYCG